MGEKIDAKWYEENYTPWIDDINSYGDLEKFWDNLNPRYKKRFDCWFKDIEIEGDILELGFNNGKTLKWLSDKYMWDASVYSVDFNPSLNKIIPFLMKIPAVGGLHIGNVFDIMVFKSFNHIMCLDFIEHLYHDDYLILINRIKGLLKHRGRVYVFAGYAKLPEHVNILTLEEIRNDFTVAGFKYIKKIKYPETGDTMQIFEK